MNEGMNETKMNHAIIVTIVYKVRMYNGKQNCCLIRTNFSYFLNDGSIYIVYDPMRLLFTARLLHFLRHLCDYQINNYGMISKILLYWLKLSSKLYLVMISLFLFVNSTELVVNGIGIDQCVCVCRPMYKTAYIYN